MEVTEQQLDLFPTAKTAAVMSEIVEAFDRLAPDCDECGGAMRSGQAMVSTVTGTGDFNDDERAVTLSPGGPGKLVDCLKCADCGWSVK